VNVIFVQRGLSVVSSPQAKQLGLLCARRRLMAWGERLEPRSERDVVELQSPLLTGPQIACMPQNEQDKCHRTMCVIGRCSVHGCTWLYLVLCTWLYLAVLSALYMARDKRSPEPMPHPELCVTHSLLGTTHSAYNWPVLCVAHILLGTTYMRCDGLTRLRLYFKFCPTLSLCRHHMPQELTV
jgi:hypothetical protein